MINSKIVNVRIEEKIAKTTVTTTTGVKITETSVTTKELTRAVLAYACKVFSTEGTRSFFDRMECFQFVKVLKCGELKSDCLKLNLED